MAFQSLLVNIKQKVYRMEVLRLQDLQLALKEHGISMNFLELAVSLDSQRAPALSLWLSAFFRLEAEEVGAARHGPSRLVRPVPCRLVASGGHRAKLSRPLDFLVIADHSDGMGFFQGIAGGDAAFMASKRGRRWNKMINEGQGVEATLELIGAFSQGKIPWKTNDPKMMKPIWRDVIEAAEREITG